MHVFCKHNTLPILITINSMLLFESVDYYAYLHQREEGALLNYTSLL